MTYINLWETRGYSTGISDEVPDVLMRKKLAPSYKAIACALLSNDMKIIGISTKKSKWYSVLKKIEIEGRNLK